MLKRSSKFKGLLEARFRCECHAHEIEVSQWQDGEWEDEDVYLSFWYSGRNFWATTDKLKAIWRILRGMTVFQEEIILTPREAHELGRALLSVEDPENLPTMNFPSPTTTTATEDVRYRQGGTPRQGKRGKMKLVKASLRKGIPSMGWAAYWIVDEQGRHLNTEPVCTVPEGWHPWFNKHLEAMEFEHWGLQDKEEE